MANFFRAAKSLHYSLDGYADDHDFEVSSHDVSYHFVYRIGLSTGLRTIPEVCDLLNDQLVKTLFLRNNVNNRQIYHDLTYNIKSGFAKIGCPKVGPQPRFFKKKRHGRPTQWTQATLPVMSLKSFEKDFKPSKITKVPVPSEFSSDLNYNWLPISQNRDLIVDMSFTILYNINDTTLFSHILIDNEVSMGFGYSYDGRQVAVAGGVVFSDIFMDAFAEQRADAHIRLQNVIFIETEWFHAGTWNGGKDCYFHRISVGSQFWDGRTNIGKDDFVWVLHADAEGEGVDMIAAIVGYTGLELKQLCYIEQKCRNIGGKFLKAVRDRPLVEAVERVLQILAPRVRNLVVALFLFAVFRSRLSLDEHNNVFLL